MAGGSGERFWPMSRAHAPKQLIKLFGETTLLEQTVQRLNGVVPRKNIFVRSIRRAAHGIGFGRLDC